MIKYKIAFLLLSFLFWITFILNYYTHKCREIAIIFGVLVIVDLVFAVLKKRESL